MLKRFFNREISDTKEKIMFVCVSTFAHFSKCVETLKLMLSAKKRPTRS